MGMLDFDVPEEENGHRWVIRLTDDNTGSWTGVSSAPCGSCTAEISSIDSKALIIDPPDWTNGHKSLSTWMNFNLNPKPFYDNFTNVEVYWCWTPPPPTQAPT